MKYFSLFIALVLAAPASWGAGRSPSSFVAAESAGPANYLPRVEKLSDRYRLTIETPDLLPHYLVDKTDQQVWLRLVRPTTYPSQILQGDNVVKQVKLIRHRHSSDVIIKFGDDAKTSDVYFDDGRKRIVVDVMTSPLINTQESAPTPVVARKAKPAHQKRHPQQIAVKPTLAPPPAAAATSNVVIPKPVSVRPKDGKLIVVVDAGHGGLDCGAIGPRGTMEKDVNLAVARALAKALSKEKNIQVIMTRDSDVLVPLQDRTRIANEAEADMFISVHCNSSLTPKSTGFEVYYLSPAATDKAAASVARLENSVVALEVNKGEAHSRLNEVLASMAVGNFINESSKFASMICRHVKQETNQEKIQMKEADFFVLRGAQMPALLLELEYVSNPLTEIKLRSTRFQTQMVNAVVSGVRAYHQQSRLEQEALAAQMSRSLPPSQ